MQDKLQILLDSDPQTKNGKNPDANMVSATVSIYSSVEKYVLIFRFVVAGQLTIGYLRPGTTNSFARIE